MRITLDANVLEERKAQLISDAESAGYEVAVASVTERERGNPEITDSLPKIIEVFVLYESPLNAGALGFDEDADIFERVLRVISDGAFPAKGCRESLTDGERRQLRDAMAFASHVREHRDIFVTDDARSFIREERRELLQSRFGTRIMTTSEFMEHLQNVSGRA